MPKKYVEIVKTELAHWEKRKPGYIADVANFILTPFLRLVEKIVPDAIQDTIAKGIQVSLAGLHHLSKKTLYKGKINEEIDALMEQYSDEWPDFFDVELMSRDTEAKNVWNWHCAYATIEGAGSGVMGLPGLAADIPLLMSISLREIQSISLCYGYDPNSDLEKEYILQILNTASATDLGTKQAAMITLKQCEQILLKVTWKKMAESAATKEISKTAFLYALREFAKQLGIRLTKRKLLQMIPVIGALIGGAFNYIYVKDIGETAYMCYRRRFLEEKTKRLLK